MSPGRYLVADYSDPGQVVIFTRTGQLVWRFRPAGAAALNHPSLALPLPMATSWSTMTTTTA